MQCLIGRRRGIRARGLDCGWLAAGCDDFDTAARIRVLAEQTNDVLVVEHAHVASGQRSCFVKIVFGMTLERR